MQRLLLVAVTAEAASVVEVSLTAVEAPFMVVVLPDTEPTHTYTQTVSGKPTPKRSSRVQ